MRKEADWKGFGEHIMTLDEMGAPVDRADLYRLAEMYNTPPPSKKVNGEYVFEHATYDEWADDLKNK